MEDSLGSESYDTGSGHSFAANGYVPLGKLLKPHLIKTMPPVPHLKPGIFRIVF